MEKNYPMYCEICNKNLHGFIEGDGICSLIVCEDCYKELKRAQRKLEELELKCLWRGELP